MERLIIIAIFSLVFLSCSPETHDNLNENPIGDASDTVVTTEKNETYLNKTQIIPDYPYPVQPSKEDWQDDIGEVFILLPDTFFLKNQILDKYIGLNHKKRKQLVSGKKVTINQDCVLSFDNDSDGSILHEKFVKLNVFRHCIDGQTINYYLKYWITENGEKLFGLFQKYGDWCCNHSNYWFLKPTKEGWMDVTEKVIGKITLYDFKRGNQSFPKNKDFKKFINDPWFGVEVYYFTDTIKFHLDFDVLGLSMSDETYDSASNQLNYELQLIWNGGVFKKNLIQRKKLND